MAFSISIQCESNNQAEAATTNYGLNWCNRNGYTKIQLELDSLIVANMLKNKDTKNLMLNPVILDSIQLLRIMDAEAIHCYIKANGVTDLLAKQASSSGHSTFYYSKSSS
ncbi:hypothetical protein HAX54_007440 [Datura stramonium]|uniref:RNase H type-1 domain-containing protein n=1 Tax=Datura stramonium TaxID=4076 RepID=A0ABS8TCK1_DATST|nr:hypothetical protein [Datura stramonium]